MHDKYIVPESWLQNFKEPAGKEDIQMEYSSDKLCRPCTGAVTKNYL
jgi:hypothetical protein